MKVVISSGHGKYVRGASGIIDEVDEARRVVNRLGELIPGVVIFHDDVSRDQQENLQRIVDFHNSQSRDLDVSVHFNAFEQTSSPKGTECWYYSQQTLAGKVSTAIAEASGLKDRGAKQSTGLYFLNNTEEPAILIEVCFVDSAEDCRLYEENFDHICLALAEMAGGSMPPVEPGEALVHITGECSWFGGPNDTGVSDSEGLAFFYELEDAPHLFLPKQPPGTTGLARRLNPQLFYVACRWDYDVTPKSMLARPNHQALVLANDREFLAWPADWGPHTDTEKEVDLSPGLMEALGVSTGDRVEVIYPALLGSGE